MSNEGVWNDCFIKNNQEMLLDLTAFALQEQSEDNLIVVISRAWYHGSYTMAVKPIKSLELHYTMIQFLIVSVLVVFPHKVCLTHQCWTGLCKQRFRYIEGAHQAHVLNPFFSCR